MIRDLLRDKIREFLLRNYTSEDFCSCDEGDLLNQYERGVAYVANELADYLVKEFQIWKRAEKEGE